MSVHAGYDPIGTRCVGKSQPGTVALSDVVQERWGGNSLGIYVCRNKRGKTTKSAHAEGRAYDHQWFDRASGFAIANRLVAKHAELGIQVVIWYRKIWSYTHRSEGWRDYDGEDDHTTHLHIEQNWSGAHELTYAAAMRALVGTTTGPTPTPIPEEDDDMDLIVEVTDDNSPVFYLLSPTEWTEIGSAEELKVLQKNAKTVQLTTFEWQMRSRSRKHNPR